MRITVYHFQFYTGSEEEGTLQMFREENVAMRIGHDLNRLARSLMEKHNADEIDCHVVLSCDLAD